MPDGFDGDPRTRTPRKQTPHHAPSKFPALDRQSIEYKKLDVSVCSALEEFIRHSNSRKLRDPQGILVELKPEYAVAVLNELRTDPSLKKYANLTAELRRRAKKYGEMKENEEKKKNDLYLQNLRELAEVTGSNNVPRQQKYPPSTRKGKITDETSTSSGDFNQLYLSGKPNQTLTGK
eukprot:UN30472